MPKKDMEKVKISILEQLNAQFRNSKSAQRRQTVCTMDDLIDVEITGQESDYEITGIANDLYWCIVAD